MVFASIKVYGVWWSEEHSFRADNRYITESKYLMCALGGMAAMEGYLKH